MDFFKKNSLKAFGNTELRKFFLEMLLQFYNCSWVLKTFKFFGFFGKSDVLFRKSLQICINTQDGFFPSESSSKVFLAYAIWKRLNLEFFLKKVMFFSTKYLNVSSCTRIGIFFSRRRVRFPNCVEILDTVKVLGFLEK